jgi:hypothetical protein
MYYMKRVVRLARVRDLPALRTAKLRCLTPWGIRLIARQSELISEGQTVQENGSSSYYGSSMITLRAESRRGRPGGKDLDELMRHIRNNPFLNIQLSRMARMEATRRIGKAALGTAYCTLSTRKKNGTIEITIDIEIPHIDSDSRTARR